MSEDHNQNSPTTSGNAASGSAKASKAESGDEQDGTFLERLVLSKSLFWLVALVWAALDLFSKAWAQGAITTSDLNYNGRLINHPDIPDEGKPFIDGFLHLRWAENYGAAFSMGSNTGHLLTFVGLGVLGIILYYVLRTHAKRWFMLLCLSLIAGGAIGNLYDRITYRTVDPRLGSETFGQRIPAVRDFLYWPFDIPLYSTVGLDEGEPPRKWPIFNIADVGIVSGVIGMSIVFLVTPDPKRRRKDEKPIAQGSAAPPEPRGMGTNGATAGGAGDSVDKVSA